MSFMRGINEGLNTVATFAKLHQTKKDMDKADELQQAMESANKTGSEAYKAAIAAQQQATEPTGMKAAELDAQPGFGQASKLSLNSGADMGPAPSLADQVTAPQSMGGMDAATPQGLGQSLSLGGADPVAAPKQPGQAKAPVDDRDAILAGMRARRTALMDSGIDPRAWMPDWAQESKLRGEIRSERLATAEQRFQATGDPGEWARVAYPLIDDGWEFVGSKPVKSLSGGPQAWEITRRNEATGEEQTSTIDADRFSRMMLAVRDPEAMTKYEAQSLLERLKSSEAIRAEEGKQGAVRQTQLQKHGLKLREIEADGADQRRTVAARTAGEIRATRAAEGERRATERTKPIVLGADATLVERDQRGEYQPVAKGKDKATGADTPTSAPNKILQLRAQAEAAIRANPSAAKDVKARFKALTGKDY
jgi:hypothetical protein